jgi:ABC-type glycerol-3-phosphate transport system permease component
VALFNAIPFGRYMVNSLFVASTVVVVQLFFSSLAGFALAKYEFPGKKLIMVLMLATLMIPNQVVMAPLYEQLYRLGLVDTYLGLIIPGAVSVFGIFLFRQAILQVPDELLQAARIDGCSEFQIYWDIVMPVSRPMVGAFCLISFMATWNSFLWPQIILHSKERFTLPIGLNQLVGLQQQQYGALMAGTLLSILPIIVLFLLLQKEFVAGLTSGAVKG